MFNVSSLMMLSVEFKRVTCHDKLYADFFYSFLAQLSRSAYTIISRKPYIASLEIWTIGLWTVGPFDYDLIQMDGYPADSCAVSPSAFLLVISPSDHFTIKLNIYMLQKYEVEHLVCRWSNVKCRNDSLPAYLNQSNYVPQTVTSDMFNMKLSKCLLWDTTRNR